ncbi:response regulator [Brevibacillus ruminantium]|uniref:histidine kinase n=1 Tax=Brevibacillus ruminantium TaxID=2950604 RepID=A0ABY4WHM9_9BACL|nr:ATP-binding protein [Brevibacillus ruminantium]USG66651.1 response regulator [Brevibacillus ruminantium]
MKYKTKLLIGFGSLLVLMMVLMGTIFNVLTNLTASIHEIVDDRYEKLKSANDMQNHVNNMSRLVTSIVLDENQKSFQEDKRRIEESIREAGTSLALLQNKVHVEQGRTLLSKISAEYEMYTQLARRVMEKVEIGQKREAASLISQDLIERKEELFYRIKELKDLQESLLDDAYDRSMEEYEFIKMLSLYFIGVGLLVGIVVTLWVIQGISKNLAGITSVISTVVNRSTEKFPRIPVTSQDEIGDIAKAFNKMASTLEEHAQQEKEFTQAMREQSWMKTQLAEITSLFQGIQDVQTLANLFIRRITPLVGASYGAIYIRDGQTDSTRLIKAGTYACDHSEIGASFVEVGQGLVGQCAVENHILHLTDLPEEYIRISSDLGQADPASIILLPVPYEGKVLAVVELATFTPFSAIQINLLEEITATMGITIHSIFVHMQIRNLLRESQILTEELQSQSEELQLQQEELRSINEKLEEQYKNSEQKAKELERVKEELERQADQVQKASRYKSEFLANMSHELRTPLNSLLILSQILLENKDKNLTERQLEYVQTILKSGNNLLNLINDILDLTRIESGKMVINRGDVSLREMGANALRGFQHLAVQKQLEFRVEIADDVPELIWSDEQRLQQIITNLLANAFKFTSQGGVYLHISRVAKAEGEHVAIAVRDTGIGIQSKNQEIIFEAFQQADGTTSRKYGGTGLGLSISREMANLLGGFIQLESIEGVGSTFTLYLPILQKEEESGVLDAYALPPVATGVLEKEYQADSSSLSSETPDQCLKGKKVLVVDDDMRNIFALTAALEEREMIVIYAENGREGIELLYENADVDIVLMDIMMPEMDGYEAIREIRGIPAMMHLPIIALTAKAMKHDREKCIEVGASDYISKPVEIEQLLSLMQVWLYG